MSAVSAPPMGAADGPPRLTRPAPVPRAVSPRVAEVVAAVGAGPGGSSSVGDEAEAEAVRAFWAEVSERGAPLVEPDPAGDPHHAVVTFVWRGTDATRAVLALPNKILDPRDLTANLMDRVPGTDIWHWSVRMRRDWRATYTLCVDEGAGHENGGRGDGGGAEDGGGTEGGGGAPGTVEHCQWLRHLGRPDPLNPHSLPRRWSGEAASVVELPEAPGAVDWQPRPGVATGRVAVHTVPSAVLGGERRVWTYEPPGAADQRELPVLVLFDGEMWQPSLGVATLLDNLIADGRIPPVLALLPDSVDSATRWTELTCADRFVTFLDDELLPWAGARWPVTADPSRTVLAGQSLGGLMSAYAALRAAHRFGNALSQSGSFWWPNGPGEQWVTRLVEGSERLPVRFRLSAGEQEWVLLPATRRLRDVLAAKGYDDATYREFNGGHDYLCWRTELADGLVELLGDAPAPAPASPHASTSTSASTSTPTPWAG